MRNHASLTISSIVPFHKLWRHNVETIVHLVPFSLKWGKQARSIGVLLYHYCST